MRFDKVIAKIEGCIFLPHNVVFPHKRYGNIPTGNPRTGASKAGGVADFQPIYGSIACCERFDCQVQPAATNLGSRCPWYKRRRLFLTGEDHDVFMAKTIYAKDNRSAFLPRDAMHNHGLCCRVASVCPSVRLSVCHVRAFCRNE